MDNNNKKRKKKYKNRNNANTNMQDTAVQAAGQNDEGAQTEAGLFENGADSGINKTPEVIETPKVIEAPEVIETPKVTETPDAIEIPEVTVTDGAADTQKNSDGIKQEVKREARTDKRQKLYSAIDIGEMASADTKATAVKVAKILLPVVAGIIVIALIVLRLGVGKDKAVDSAAQGTGIEGGAEWYDNNPLKENEYAEINELMNKFYKALADGDMDTVRALKEDSSDKDIITYEKKSEYVESYNDINCYTKSGVDADTYFVYVTYSIKVPDIETTAPGLEAWYVYSAEDGSLKIDGEVTDESVLAAWKLVTNQDDVVELYNKINLGYEEALASNEAFKAFMDTIPEQISVSVAEALAQLESQEGGDGDVLQASGDEQPKAGDSEPTQNQVVNQTVKVTDVVNVRSSDSENADKIGKAQTGTELTRTEERANGWSKVIFEGKEAYIKSAYLEVVSSAAVTEPETPAKPAETEKPAPAEKPAETEKPAPAEKPAANVLGKVMALTNVNVRNKASQDSDKIGTAMAGNSYDLLEDNGEWFKISYNGTIGFVKAEYFQK